jgi:hypothetical protein
VCWPLLCSRRTFCIFERYLNSNPESWVSSRYAINLNLATPFTNFDFETGLHWPKKKTEAFEAVYSLPLNSRGIDRHEIFCFPLLYCTVHIYAKCSSEISILSPELFLIFMFRSLHGDLAQAESRSPLLHAYTMIQRKVQFSSMWVTAKIMCLGPEDRLEWIKKT